MSNTHSEHIPVVSKSEVYRFFGSKWIFTQTIIPKLKTHNIDCSIFEQKSQILPRDFVLQLFHVEQINVSEWEDFIRGR